MRVFLYFDICISILTFFGIVMRSKHVSQQRKKKSMVLTRGPSSSVDAKGVLCLYYYRCYCQKVPSTGTAGGLRGVHGHS